MSWRIALTVSLILAATGIYLIVTGSGPVIPVYFLDPVTGKSVTPSVADGGFRESAVIGRVIDGDTVELTDGRKVRYIGIDTPETGGEEPGKACFGSEASQKNKGLVEGKQVLLEKDVSETDRYGRLLRYVYVDGVFVNEALVRQGFARISTFPPDVKYSIRLLESEEKAREENIGLWSGCR